MDTLVSTEWLSQHLDDPDLVLLDCTVTTLSKSSARLRWGGSFNFDIQERQTS